MPNESGRGVDAALPDHIAGCSTGHPRTASVCQWLTDIRDDGSGAIQRTEWYRGCVALEDVMRATGPAVLDVVVDPTRPSPLLQRIRSLQAQGVTPPEKDSAL